MLFSKKHVKVNPRCLVNTVDFSKPDLVCPDFPNKLFFYQLHMNYQEFLSTVQAQLSLRIETDVSLDIQSFTKNNGTKYDGLVILRPGRNVSPTIYLQPYYHRYLDGVCLDEICDDILNTYRTHEPKENFDTGIFTDFSRAGKRIVLRLVNYEKNTELLKQVPYFRYLDLAVIFYCMLHADSDNQANILIRNEHLKYWKISKDELYDLAKKNTPKLLMPQLTPMKNILEEMHVLTEPELMESVPPLYVLTNQYRTNGAAVMIYDGLLQEVSGHLQSDLIILPSSIHEVLLLAADESEHENMSHYNDMVKEVNEFELPDEEILSDHAYYYSRKSNLVLA